MPVYVSASRIAEAIERSGNSKAKAGLLDFLIVKRTFTIVGRAQVAIVQSEPAYIQALEELAGCGMTDGEEVKPETPYLNIFAITDKKQGYRSRKYASNGTNTTIAGNPWNSVIEIIPGDPRQATLQPGYEGHLERLLLSSSIHEPKPSIDDVAIWYFRTFNIERIVGAAEADNWLYFLRERFIERLGLTPAEIAVLFDVAPVPIDATALVSDVADPREYLPGLALAPIARALPAEIPGVCSADLVTALAAKPFVILTGPSGTGKSRAALKLAEGLEQVHGATIAGSLFQLVPVGPDWTSPKRLLGYRTPFGELRTKSGGVQTNESYEITETLRLILRAAHPDATGIPHFLIFDEMNLSHVERYFSTFLSLMEAGNSLDGEDAAALIDPQSLKTVSEVLTHENSTSAEAVSAKLMVDHGQNLTLPSNIFFVGTVNVDETTYMFSPKVLDRAHVIEIESERPSTYLTGAGATEPGGIMELLPAGNLLRAGIDDREGQRYEVPNPAIILDRLVPEAGLTEAEVEEIRRMTILALDGCYSLLGPVGFAFGYRTAKEVFTYVYVWANSQLLQERDKAVIVTDWPIALDKAILQKVLPKIHGNKRVLSDSLKALAAFLRGSDTTSNPPARYSLGMGSSYEIPTGQGLVLPVGKVLDRSATKLDKMHARLAATGYVSFVS